MSSGMSTHIHPRIGTTGWSDIWKQTLLLLSQPGDVRGRANRVLRFALSSSSVSAFLLHFITFFQALTLADSCFTIHLLAVDSPSPPSSLSSRNMSIPYPLLCLFSIEEPSALQTQHVSNKNQNYSFPQQATILAIIASTNSTKSPNYLGNWIQKKFCLCILIPPSRSIF